MVVISHPGHVLVISFPLGTLPYIVLWQTEARTYWCNSRTFWRNLPNQSRRQSTPNTLDGCRKAVADLNFRGKRSQGLVSSSIPHRKVQWKLISNLFCCNERGISVPDIWRMGIFVQQVAKSWWSWARTTFCFCHQDLRKVGRSKKGPWGLRTGLKGIEAFRDSCSRPNQCGSCVSHPCLSWGILMDTLGCLQYLLRLLLRLGLWSEHTTLRLLTNWFWCTAKWKTSRFLPNHVFAETYIVSLLQTDAKIGLPRDLDDLCDVLRDKPIERLQAAREALRRLRDFKADGLKLTGLSNNIERALERLFQ